MIISVMYYLSGYTNFVGLIASEAGRWMRTKKRSGLGQATKIIVYKSWGELFIQLNMLIKFNTVSANFNNTRPSLILNN